MKKRLADGPYRRAPSAALRFLRLCAGAAYFLYSM